MKVLHLTKFDSSRGAAIAAKRLHEAMLTQEVESWMLCDLPSGDTPKSIGLRAKSNWLMDKIRGRCNMHLKSLQVDPDVYYTSLNFRRNRLLAAIDALKPDIVHIHWVGNDFLRIEDLPKLCKKYCVVWTLHDMWPFCGAEHIAFSENRWSEGYTKVNRSPAAHGLDLNRWVWQRKLKSWSGCTIHTISVSSWMDECVQRSKLFRGINGARTVIPNGIDMSVFTAPHDHRGSFSGMFETKGRRPKLLVMATPLDLKLKGIEFFIGAMQLLFTNNAKLDIITFGGPAVPDLPPLGTVTQLGRIESTADLASVYASADLMVTASRMESFGQTAAEALACGTPVVCFDTTGLRDIVLHKQNGYRAECFSHESLAEGILWCLENPERYQGLQAQARPSAVERFSIETIASTTLDFYESIQ